MNSSSDAKCANCEECGYECTYVEQAKRRGPPKGYIETLEQRCGRLEKVLAQVSHNAAAEEAQTSTLVARWDSAELEQLQPSLDINSTVGPPPDKEEFDQQEYSERLRSLGIPAYPAVKQLGSHVCGTNPSVSISAAPSAIHSASVSPPAAPASSPASRILGPAPWSTYQQDPNRPPEDDDHEDDDAHVSATIAEAMSKLEVKDVSWRFHGKASGAHLMRVISDLKYGQNSPQLLEIVARNKRNEYWKIPEWEIVIAQEGVNPLDYSNWPEPPLDRVLIDAYFTYVNIYLPLLNKIVFDREYDSGLYRTNQEFAKICWMVFANGARFVDDDRVYWPIDLATSDEGRQRLLTDADGTRRYSAGWKYIRALIKMGRSIVAAPSLHDFQCQVLVCAFLAGSAIPHMTWLLSGYGLRSAQELGIHVRSTLLHADPTERALYNRAFWCLYHIDRLNCAAIGRSVALQDTDFDADYPIAVDDQYWETGDRARDFVQPPDAGLPSVSAFIHMLKLDHVIGAALRTIYAVNKSPEAKADPTAQREVVVELDSALNSWADAVPDGLRWDPSRADQQAFQQSAVLYAQYYYCQILIHRPFIPTPRNPNTVGLPSLAICSNASRSICNILDAALRRGRQFGLLPGRILDGSFLVPAWVAAIVLLISVHAGKMQPGDKERTVKDIRKCLAAIKDMELTWRQAGKLTDLLTELLREDGTPPVGAQRLPIMPHGQKRPLYNDTDFEHAPYPFNLNSSANANANANIPLPNPSTMQPGLGGQSQPSGQGIPSTPPFLWNWNNGPGPVLPGMAMPTTGASALDNGGTGMMAMDSWFDNAVFGGMHPSLAQNVDGSGPGMGVTSSGEEDLWQQLFGGYP